MSNGIGNGYAIPRGNTVASVFATATVNAPSLTVITRTAIPEHSKISFPSSMACFHVLSMSGFVPSFGKAKKKVCAGFIF